MFRVRETLGVSALRYGITTRGGLRQTSGGLGISFGVLRLRDRDISPMSLSHGPFCPCPESIR
jgi:hypothetical protein